MCVAGVARYIIAILELYSASEIVTRLLGQLNIDAGLVNEEWRPTLRRQLKLIVYRRYLHQRFPSRLATVSARIIVGFEVFTSCEYFFDSVKEMSIIQV